MNQNHTHVLDGISVALGLDWQSLRTDTSEKNEAAEIAKQDGRTHGTIFMVDNISYLGIYPGVVSGAPYCGAACLAIAASSKKIENVAIIETLSDDGDIWFCAVRNGVPLKGYDRVTTISEVSKLISDLNQSYHGFIFYSRDGVIDGTESGSFSEFIGIDDGRMPEGSPKVVRLRGVSRIFLLAMIMVAGASVVIAGAYSYFNNKAETVAAIEAATTLRMKQVATQAEIAKAEADAKLELERQFNSKIGSVPLYADMVNGWLDSISETPSNLAGWELSDVDCNMLSCVAKYTRKKGSTLNDFIQASKTIGMTLGSISGNEVQSTYKLDFKERRYSADSLPEEKMGLWPVLTQLQLMELANLSFKVKTAEPIHAMTAQLPEKPPVKIFSTWKLGEYILSGNRFFEIRDSAEYMQFDHVSALSLKINMVSGNWSIGGSYATK